MRHYEKNLARIQIIRKECINNPNGITDKIQFS